MILKNTFIPAFEKCTSQFFGSGITSVCGPDLWIGIHDTETEGDFKTVEMDATIFQAGSYKGGGVPVAGEYNNWVSLPTTSGIFA